jgi:hypothetical protein
MLPSGTLLNNRYRVKRELGRGGMGAVYEAIDERFDSPVALKQNLSHNTITVNAFAREARLLRKIKHDAFPLVSDYFAETDGGQYMVMELIAGPDLEKELAARRRPFAVDEVARWADRLLDALEVLHNPQDPVIHRDIKPANLKLDEKGQIKLLDFGIAKGAAGDKPQAGDSRSVNFVTLAYAPVEQILRCSGDVYLVLFANHAAKVEAAAAQGTDGRSDLFALGATLYHFLTGVAPTPASARAAAVWAGQKDPLIAPHLLNPDAPPELSAIICRALALERQDRYADAAAMRQALRDWREAKQREAAAAERRRLVEERQRLQAEADAQKQAAQEAARRAERLETQLRESEERQRAETDKLRQQAALAEQRLREAQAAQRQVPLVTEELPRREKEQTTMPVFPPPAKPFVESEKPSRRRVFLPLAAAGALAVVGAFGISQWDFNPTPANPVSNTNQPMPTVAPPIWPTPTPTPEPTKPPATETRPAPNTAPPAKPSGPPAATPKPTPPANSAPARQDKQPRPVKPKRTITAEDLMNDRRP